MLEEVHGVKRRHEFHGHQVLVGPQDLGFGTDGGVASQPLDEGLVIFAPMSLQVLLVDLVSVLLARMWRTKLLGLFVSPGHFDV